ncbi:dienelactone hydrolase family protein [Burkholderia stagnalis]
MHFPSTDGPPATMLDGYLFAAPGAGRHPALVFLHGCSGMFAKSGKIHSRERDWAARFNAAGITVMEVDSFNPRHHGEMCAPAHFDNAIYRARPFDAYGALRYLQSLDNVRPDRIGVVGWSLGGGTVLNTIRASSPARPASLPDGDFRAAVAFYPASCDTKRQGAVWRSPVPLLVLIGEQDVWTPFAACRTLFDSVAPGTDATFHAYPGAYHDFDWPDMPVHATPAFTTKAGVVPIEGTEPRARADARRRVVDYVGARLLDR